MASLTLAIIGAGDGMLPLRCQAIIQTSTDIVSVEVDENRLFIKENSFENVVCTMSAILFK